MMKVFAVFRTDGNDCVLERAFIKESNARIYVDQKNETTEFGWHFETVEVE
jgi:hypothetical protein